MKIYLAAFFHTYANLDRVKSANMKVLQLSDYPYYLESFHYMRTERDAMASIRRHQKTIFLDSGAFSMFTQKVDIDLKSYAQFIKDNSDVVHIASNLDAIGAGNEQVSYDRQKQLEQMGVVIQPVHHVRDHDDWLKRYLDEGYDYIFLGGMVPENNATLTLWLDHIWHHYLTKPDGTPKIKVHGFGLTALRLIFRYPWYSVDSTSWRATGQFGSLLLDFPQPDGTIKDFKIDFSTKSSARFDDNSWHFNSLRSAEKNLVLERLEQLETTRPKNPEIETELAALTNYKPGFNVDALSQSYGWRDFANIEYFKRAMNRKIDRFTRQQDTLF